MHNIKQVTLTLYVTCAVVSFHRVYFSFDKTNHPLIMVTVNPTEIESSRVTKIYENYSLITLTVREFLAGFRRENYCELCAQHSK